MTIKVNWLKKNLLNSTIAAERREMVEHNHPELTVKRQAELLEVNRTSIYYKPSEEEDKDIELMQIQRWYNKPHNKSMGVMKLGKKQLTSRDLQALETRQKIFDTAFKMITEQGVDEVTIESICKRSGVAKSLFYHYFKSKADIVIETYKIIDEKFTKEIAELPLDIDPIEKIAFTVTFQARYAREKGVKFVRQIYKSQLDTGTSFFISEERPFYRLIRDSVKEGQANGQIRDNFPPEVLTRLILSTSRGIIYDWCLHDGTYDIEKVMRDSFNILLQSLRL